MQKLKLIQPVYSRFMWSLLQGILLNITKSWSGATRTVSICPRPDHNDVTYHSSFYSSRSSTQLWRLSSSTHNYTRFSFTAAEHSCWPNNLEFCEGFGRVSKFTLDGKLDFALLMPIFNALKQEMTPRPYLRSFWKIFHKFVKWFIDLRLLSCALLIGAHYRC